MERCPNAYPIHLCFACCTLWYVEGEIIRSHSHGGVSGARVERDLMHLLLEGESLLQDAIRAIIGCNVDRTRKRDSPKQSLYFRAHLFFYFVVETLPRGGVISQHIWNLMMIDLEGAN